MHFTSTSDVRLARGVAKVAFQPYRIVSVCARFYTSYVAGNARVAGGVKEVENRRFEYPQKRGQLMIM
jgi:hypothetical protein